MRIRKGRALNRFDAEELEPRGWSPMRWLLTVAAVVNVLVGIWLLLSAAEATGTWPVGWRIGLAVLLNAGAFLFAISGVLGLAERQASTETLGS